MEVLYFAWVRERIGLDRETVELPADVLTVGDAIRWLADRSVGHGEALGEASRLRAALDQRFARPEEPIAGARELAIFPPVTGG